MAAIFKPNEFGWGATPKPVSTGLYPGRLWFQPQGVIHDSSFRVCTHHGLKSVSAIFKPNEFG
ncbi:MAG: hypothetical protein CVU40_18605 [Chloroflexi bacterium HGW-Chloroflexi-2]|nr:MAG: hypothetical protein CVU40_18605 [Chloroflexi bacterium HGW-Chloroflexi-2]